jgi:hypothetical protein
MHLGFSLILIWGGGSHTKFTQMGHTFYLGFSLIPIWAGGSHTKFTQMGHTFYQM